MIQISETAAQIFNRRFQESGIRAHTVVYVDDFLVIADDHQNLCAAFDLMDEEGALLGLRWNPAKDVGRESPSQVIEFLGVELDAQAQTIRLPAGKAAKYLAEVHAFQERYKHSDTAGRRSVERLVGRLGWAARCCRFGFLHLQNVFDVARWNLNFF
jgi:hypothetical protein